MEVSLTQFLYTNFNMVNFLHFNILPEIWHFGDVELVYEESCGFS
jgi:hypothetical protein